MNGSLVIIGLLMVLAVVGSIGVVTAIALELFEDWRQAREKDR